MSDVQELRAVSDAYFAAWPKKDSATIATIEHGRGYGHSTAFPRSGGAESARKDGLDKYFSLLDFINEEIVSREIEVIGDTGLVWGHYAQTTKQKDGPVRTVYLRFTHTYARIGDEWKLVLYHRSLIPSEHVP